MSATRQTAVSPQDLSDEEKAILLTLASMPAAYETDRIYFEKALFLLTRSGAPELDALAESFEPYKKGPYSGSADDILLRLRDMSLLETTRMALSSAGRDTASSLRKDPEFTGVVKLSDDMWKIFKEQGFTRRDILYLVYKLYPEFASQSEMSPKDIQSDRLEHYTIREGAIKEGAFAVVTSDKGNVMTVSKKGGRLTLLPKSRSQ